MKKITIKLITLLLALAAVFSLAACNTKPQQSGYVTPVPQGEKFEVKGGSIKFSYSGATTEEARGAANAFIEAFNKKYPNVKVEKDYAATDPSARISSGDIGDVFYFAEVSAYNYAITQSALMPLEYYMEVLEIDRGDVYSGIFDAGMINNHLYYVARDFNQLLFIYNADAINQKGLSSQVVPEWTWQEFLALCEQITDDDYIGAQLNLPYAPQFIPFLEAYEGRGNWFSLKDKKIDVTSGDTLKALDEALDACRLGYIDLMIGGDFGGKEPVFKYLVYPSILGEAKTYDSKKVTWDLINLPLFEHPAFGAGSSGWGVYNRTGNPDAAAAFALFFYTAEGQVAFNGQDGGSVPLLSSLKDEDFWKHPNDEWSDKNWDACVYRAEDAATVGQFNCLLPPEIADIFSMSALQSVLSRALNGTQSLQDGMAALETKANQKWATIG
jgi:ABC-type glycerol-3-phosphate transport system substrate-binding protein